MTMKATKLGAALAAGMVLALAGNASQAAVVYATDTANPVSIPSLAGFATTGAMMAGMTVQVAFVSNGVTSLQQSLAWQTTGPSSGGVFGTGWSLTLDGDSFSQPWSFNIQGTDLGQLALLRMTGLPGLTVFDRTDPSFGTDGSANGRDFVFLSGYAPGDSTVTVTYSEPVKIGTADPVLDIWNVLTVDFYSGDALVGPRVPFSFGQDTDNDSSINRIPEPGTLALLGLGLAGLAASRRRWKQ